MGNSTIRRSVVKSRDAKLGAEPIQSIEQVSRQSKILYGRFANCSGYQMMPIAGEINLHSGFLSVAQTPPSIPSPSGCSIARFRSCEYKRALCSSSGSDMSEMFVAGRGYSANVEIRLEANGQFWEVAQVGECMLILQNPCDLPPMNARIEIIIEGEKKAYPVLLFRGASRESPIVEFR